MRRFFYHITISAMYAYVAINIRSAMQIQSYFIIAYYTLKCNSFLDFL